VYRMTAGQRIPPMDYLCMPCSYFWGRTSMRRHILSSRRGGSVSWPSATVSALRAMLLFALSGSSHTLRWLGAYDEIRLFELRALQSSDRSLLLKEDQVRNCAVALRDPKRVRATTAVAHRHASATLGPSALCQDDHLLFTHSLRSSIASLSRRLLASGAAGVAQWLVEFCGDPQTVQ
jgi:hypothetical protein